MSGRPSAWAAAMAGVMAARLGLPLPGRGSAASPRPPARRRDELKHHPERALLELALASPEAARVLAQGGALEGLADPELASVAQALRLVLERGGLPTPDAVIQALADQDLARVVSRLSQCGLNCADPAQAAKSHLREWEKVRSSRLLSEFSQAIAAAQARGDVAQVAELQARRMRFRKLTSPSLSTGKE